MRYNMKSNVFVGASNQSNARTGRLRRRFITSCLLPHHCVTSVRRIQRMQRANSEFSAVH